MPILNGGELKSTMKAVLENGTKPLVDGFEGRRSIALLNAIYRSAAKGGEKELV
ncbi:hypothetical protein ALTERO38_60397 [Alteromonas sp. 38]|nr:hypothetical protein ALTER154_40396 [Alteromonas sp. 154]VXC20020.1 hypothetical protein ALTERO38_60397 [Alteromonas sp. 38]